MTTTPPTQAQIVERLAEHSPIKKDLFQRMKIDPQDEWLLHFPWREDSSSSKYTSYARCSITRDGWSKKVLLHRVIMQPERGQLVDHINGDGLDNRRCNLRICSREENSRNSRPHGKTSKYKGVSWRKKDGLWVMHIRGGGERATEIFKDEEQAARRYDELAKELHGEFAYLNFPNVT